MASIFRHSHLEMKNKKISSKSPFNSGKSDNLSFLLTNEETENVDKGD